MSDGERSDPHPNESLAAEAYCYLTTTGRVTGLPRQIEIWFALQGRRLYLLAGSRYKADWVRNLRKQLRVRVRIGATTFDATATIVTDPDEDALARRLLIEKYEGGYAGSLTRWGRTALPVAIDLDA
ncbi:MAG: nitroreductase family deazaflavin-dependent oxidoreductase [Dehalococcoidia bacterium]|nr:nitroreductase family deazaflavin-dependent oxidoreductase [Dehalococcoidia bacterium]